MAMQDLSGDISLERVDAATLVIRLTGDWFQGARIKPVQRALAQLGEAKTPPPPECDKAPDLNKWDNRLPAYLLKILDYCQAYSIESDLSGLPEGVQGLLKLARAVPERAGAAASRSQRRCWPNWARR
jgi:phospholipid/cholesterol/gamma-HCH transport system permease protein